MLGYDGVTHDESYNITATRTELSYMYYVNLGNTAAFTTT